MAWIPENVRWALWAACGLGYAGLAHYTNITKALTLGMLVALAPLLLLGLSLAWQSPYRRAALALYFAACLVIVLTWGRLTHFYGLVYWLEHAGTELALCALFGRTLAANREPMVTVLARKVHGFLSPELEAYTRQVTVAWAILFGGMALTSTVLFFSTSLEVWSVFANFFTAPLMALMFVAEYLVRRHLHPDMQHAPISEGIKAFWNKPA